MTILEYIKSHAPETGFIGGDISLIVGQLGATFKRFHPDLTEEMKRYKEDDKIPIIRIEGDKVSIVVFNQEMWVMPNYRFKGVSLNKKISNGYQSKDLQ